MSATHDNANGGSLVMNTGIHVWRESDGGWRWRSGTTFGTADSQDDAREAAERAALSIYAPPRPKKPRRGPRRCRGMVGL